MCVCVCVCECVCGVWSFWQTEVDQCVSLTAGVQPLLLLLLHQDERERATARCLSLPLSPALPPSLPPALPLSITPSSSLYHQLYLRLFLSISPALPLSITSSSSLSPPLPLSITSSSSLYHQLFLSLSPALPLSITPSTPPSLSACCCCISSMISPPLSSCFQDVRAGFTSNTSCWDAGGSRFSLIQTHSCRAGSGSSPAARSFCLNLLFSEHRIGLLWLIFTSSLVNFKRNIFLSLLPLLPHITFFCFVT